MEYKLKISSAPHIKGQTATRNIMLYVIIALLPATVTGAAIFGKRALLVIIAAIGSAIAAESLFNIVLKKENTVGDLSAVVTGLLLGLNLPVNVPVWQVVIGSVFAIIAVKCLFGGIGKNIVNPAITARVFMLIAFTNTVGAVDAVSGATPLAELKNGSLPQLSNLFFGNIGGAIGEVCKPALIIGGLFLVLKGVITWHIPVFYIGGTYIFSLLFGGFDFYKSLLFILSGGLIIGAIFMATDYVTSPVTVKGKIIFGIGAAFLTVIIRLYSNYPEGVSFAILLMNILTPYIDKFTVKKLFGEQRKKSH